MPNIINAWEHTRFLTKKPQVILRIAQGIFKKNITRKNTLRTIDIALNYDCHFRCEFCSASSLRDPEKKYLTNEEIAGLIIEAKKLGAIHVNFTGGEPLLRGTEEICKIIKDIHPRKMLVSLVTNGLELSEHKIRMLKDAGMDTLQFSIESLDPKNNGKLRGGEGILEKSLHFADYAKKQGLNICINTVIYKNNLEEIKKISDLCLSKGYFMNINLASSVGNWKNKESLKIDNTLLKELNRLLNQKHIRNDTSWNFNLKRGCPGGTERLYITAYGDVMTCPLVHVSYGNIREQPLKTIYSKISQIPIIKQNRPYCKHTFEEEYRKKICLPSEKQKKHPVPFESLHKK